MGEVVNLRRIRKERGKAAKAKVAAERRVVFGRTKAERVGDEKRAEAAEKVLDGAWMEAGEE